MNKQISYRIFFYVLGLLILALGLTLNTKAGLGVSPIISVSYSVAQIFGLNFGNTTMFLYCVFVLAQLVLHGIQWKQHPETDYRFVLLMDVLQIPLSLVFTRFLNLFGAFFPDLSAGAAGHPVHRRGGGAVASHADCAQPGRRHRAWHGSRGGWRGPRDRPVPASGGQKNRPALRHGRLSFFLSLHPKTPAREHNLPDRHLGGTTIVGNCYPIVVYYG